MLGWRSRGTREPTKPPQKIEDGTPGDEHLQLARESLSELLEDARVPATVRGALAQDYADIRAMLDKLEHGHLHIAAFGRVSVGKSSLLNALLGERHFFTSPLHGATTDASMKAWTEFDAGGVYLIDTPGINEVDGETREKMSHEVASRVDLILFVVDGDISAAEIKALRELAMHPRPILVVLNKADRYTGEERTLLLETLRERVGGLVNERNVLLSAAEPAEKVYITREASGGEQETRRRPEPDVADLKLRIWQILESEGKTLAALNASLFAGNLSDQVAKRVLEARRAVGEKVIRTYCIAKGVAVALNPVPVTDLFAAAMVDLTLVTHLSRVYKLPLTRAESGNLVRVILTQAAAVMGTVWALHLVSAALKVGTGGVSTLVTAGAQGAVAYYSTYIVGQAAEQYLVQGKSWGPGGPKSVVKRILESIDRESVLAEAKADIRTRLRAERADAG